MLSKNSIMIVSLSLLAYGSLNAQHAVLASGSNAAGSGGSSSYSVGQVAYSSKGTNGIMTEGVQQPYEILTLAVDDLGNEAKNIALYPNPVKDLLFVDFNEENFKNSSYVLFDAQGKQIKRGNFSQKKSELDLSILPSSVYIIQIFRDNKNIKTFKIIKK